MINPQIEFDKTIELLTKYRVDSPHVDKLLDYCQNSTVAFACSEDKVSLGVLKANLLGIYQLEAELMKERRDILPANDYESFLRNLRKTKAEHICISNFLCRDCSFKVFSDFDKTEFIGLLLSNATLQEAREKVNSIKELTKTAGIPIQLDESLVKNVFVKGQLQS